MNLQEVYTASKIFYCMTSGNHDYTIPLQAELTVKVNEEHLRKAVKRAMAVHPHFYNCPVISDNKVYTVRQDGAEVPVFPETNKGRCYGTEDTCGYLFYVTFEGTDLYLRMFHGLCDGRGGYMFLSTLLYFYFQECGIIFEPDPDTVTERKSEEPFDAYGKTLETISGDRQQPAGFSVSRDSFALPETFFSNETNSYKLMEIDTQLLPLLEASKKCSSSVAPFLASLIGSAIHDMYEVGDKTIVAYMPVDLRTRFGFETSENASSSTFLPYAADMQQLPPEERAGKLRNILNFLTEPENQCSLKMTRSSMQFTEK